MNIKSPTIIYERTSGIVRKCACFKWIIKDFSLYDCRESSIFPTVDASWKFVINPRTVIHPYGKVQLELYYYQTDPKYELKKDVNCKISLQNKNGEPYSVFKGYHNFKEGSYRSFIIMDSDVLLKDKREELLPNDTLTIFCELTYWITKLSSVIQTEKKGDEINSTGAPDHVSVTENHSKLEREHEQQVDDIKNGGEMQETEKDSAENYLSTNVKGFAVLSQNFEDLLHREHLCDVTINVQDKTFQAHTLILSARSSVLATMLQHDMKEKHTGVVNIVDCDPVTFEDFLLYLYSGKMEIVSSKNVLGLYKAADKYDVKDLKEECVRFMMSNMSVEIICDAIALAVIHSETELIKNATEYFIANTHEILLTVRWQKFLKENPEIANELYIKAFSKNFDKR